MAYNWNAQLAASANAKVKREKTPEELQQEQYKKNQSDFSNWRVVGQGVLDAGLDDSKTALARMMDAVGDKNAAYDRAYQTMMGKNTSQTMAEDLRTYLDSFARHGDGAKRIADFPYGSGGGGGRRSTTQSGVDFRSTSVPEEVTAEYDRRIRELQNAIQAAGEAGDYTAADLNAQLKQAKADREAAVNKYALNNAMDYYKDRNPNELSDELMQSAKLNNRGQTREVRDLTDLAQARADEQARTGRLSDLYSQLYEAQGGQGEDAMGRAEAIQREINQLEAAQRAKAQREANTADYSDSEALEEATRNRVDEYNRYQGMGSVDQMNSRIDSLQSKIDLAEDNILSLKDEQVLYAANHDIDPSTGSDDTYYQYLERSIARQNADIDNAKQEIDALKKDIENKLAYDASLTPEERQYLEGLSDMLDVVEERNDAVLRAAEVLADAQQDYIDKNREASVANAETRAYSDAYRMRVNQLNALAAQYKSMSRSGASADELQTMYDAVQQAYADTNILGNAAASRHEDAVQAAEERSLAEQTLLGAQNAMGIVSGQLGNAIGRYYDAIYEQFTVPNEYKEAYEQVQGLDVLISGYERKLDNAVTAEEAAEYQRRLGELKAERANLFAYAYEYDMSRTLSGLSSRELYELGQIVMFEEDPGAYASGGPAVGGKNRMPNWMRAAASGENILDKIFGALYPNVNKDILSGKYKINSKTGEKELKSTSELLESGTDFAARIREYERKYKEEWGEDKYNSIMAMVRLEADRRHWNEYAAKLKEGSTLESILFAPVSIVTNALSAPGAITEIAVQMLDNVDAPINTYSSGFAMQNATRAIRGTASEKIEESITNVLGNGVFGQSIAQTASGVFGTMLSMADTMVAAGIGSYTGIPWAGELMLGATAATNAAQEAVDRGDDPAHAVARGIIAGVFESLFEHLSIENIQAMQKAEVLTSVDQLLSNMRKSMISEGSEEFFTEVANLAADAVVWAAGGKSELANRYEEIKQQYKLTDPQANKMIAVELALGLNLPEWGALGLSIAGQTLEAGAGGALMGALFVPMYQGGQLRRYLKAESSVNQALTNMENARGVEKFAKIIDMNYKLPDKYQVELSNFKTGVTTDADLNNMARQVRDAWAKYNADMKKWAQENPDEYNAAMEKRRELESVRLYTVANVDEVNAQAEAGAEAGRTDAQTEQTTQNAQEGVRPSQNESFAEEGTTTTSAEEEESEAFRAEAESEARTVLSGLESKYSGERLTNEVNREAERLIEQGGTDADRGRALLRIYNGETGGETASVPAASQQRAAVQTPTWAQGMASQDVQTVNSAVGNVVRGATERNGTINTQFAQDIIGDETVRFRASGREDLIAPFNAAVQEAIAGGNENANVHNNENVRRTSGANPAEQSRSVAGSAGEAAGTEGSFAESGEQRRAESGRAGQTGGSERVTETSEAAQTTAVPEGMTDMSELIPGAGKKGNYVRVASSEQGKPGYKRRYRRIAEEGRKAGYKVNFVEGGDLVFETENGKTIATNGAINTDTKEIWLRGDDPDFTVEQLFQHEFFHGLDEQLKKDIADIVRQEYGTRLNGVIAQYGIYYEGASNDPAYLMEELCADIYAGMNRGGYGQSALTEKVRAAAEAGRTQRETRPEATQTQQETRKGEYVPPKANPEDYIRFSMSSRSNATAEDTAYMGAVESGDMDTAQRMVDEAAEAAGYTEKLYHGTNQFGFTVADTSYSGDSISFFATDDPETAGTYTREDNVRRISSVDNSPRTTERYEYKGLWFDTQEDLDKFKSTYPEYRTRSELSALEEESWDSDEAMDLYGDADFQTMEGNRAYDDYDSKHTRKTTFREMYEHPDQYGHRDLERAISVWDSNIGILDVDEEAWYKPASEVIKSFFGWLEEYSKEEDGVPFEELLDWTFFARPRPGDIYTPKSRGIYELYANPDNLEVVDAGGARWSQVPYHGRQMTTRQISRTVHNEGNRSGVLIKNVRDTAGTGSHPPANVYIFFNPQEQVKSADPVTYDDDGNVIPLSERFNRKNNDLRFSRASSEDLRADVDAGYALDEDAAEPTAADRAGAVAAMSELDRRARDAYDAALANGDRELADKIRKQRAAEDKARGLYREINMERKAYNADGNVDHLNRANSLMAEARDARREARKLAESTRLDVESQYTPTQAIKRTENNLMSTYSIKRGERAKTRTRIRNVLNDAYLNGYVDYSTAYRLLSDMYDISTDYIAPDPAYDDIHRDLRGKHVYVSPQVRALFGDEWNQIRREYYSYGIYLTTSRNTADITIGEAYERNAEKYPGILNPTVGEAYDDERIYNLLSALQLSEGADVSLGEAAEMKNIGATEDFGSRLDKAFGILKEFADAANIEVRGKAKADMNTLKVRTRFEEKEQLARERRAHAVVYDKVQRELDRIYKRAKVNQQNKVRLASEQNAAIRESMEDMFDDLNEVAKSIMGDDVDLTNLLGIVEWLKKTSNEKAGFDALGWDESTGGQLAQDVDKLAKFMNGKDLNIEELQDLLDILRTIEHHLKLVNEMSESNFESLGGAAPQLTQDLLSIKRKSTKAIKARHLLNEDSLSYSRNLKRYSDWNPHGVMYHMAENLEKGDMNYMAYREGADMVLMPFLERRNNEKRRAWLATAAGKNAKLTELTLPAAQITGRGDASISETVKVKVNQMQLVQMYLDLRNEDNVRHVENGGYTFLDSELHKEGKDTDAAKRGVIIKMSADQMQDITDRYLDDTGKEFADLLFQYYNEYAKPLINNVSRAIDGRDKAVTPNYYPIRVDTGMGIPDSYNVFRGSLEGMGPLTERNSGASNAILLIDADQTFQWHKEMMARYVGYAKPLRDLRTLLNYTEGGRKNSDLLTEKFTSNSETLMHDLFGMLETAQFEKAKTLSTIFGNYISNVLTANISSMLKQFAALPLAGTSFGMEPIMYALSPKGMATKIDTDLIRKYTSYLDDRAAGIVYDQITDIVRGGNKISGQVGSARYITWQTALGRNWLGAADYWANKQMWVAAQHYVDTHTNLRPGTQAEIDAGKDLYYQKVAEVFNRMTFDTQTNSNMMSKPNILRRVDSGIKAFTLFKTDAFQIYGITREILGQMRWANQNGDSQDKHDAKLKVLHGIEGIVGASVVQSVMKYIAEFIRRRDKDYKDEDGNWDWKVFGKRVGLDTLENMTNMMAFGEEVYSLIMSVIDKDTKWYDKETAALDAINQLVSSITTNLPKLMTFFEKMSAAEDKMAYFESNIDSFATPFKKLAMQIAAFFGVPASNYEKNLIAALGWIYPDAAAALQSFGKATQKSDITNKSELKAYMKDQVGELSNEAIDAYWTLYEAFGKEALPGFGEPQMKDENGKDRDMTDEEFTKWDYAYRVAMVDAVNSMVGSEAFNGLTDDEKERALSMAADYAKQVGREAVGLDNPKWYGHIQNAISYGAELGNVLTWYKLRGNTQAEKFAALERMDIPDEQKAAILHGMYEDISTAAAWATAADSMTDMQFLEFARDKLATKLAELETVLPGSVGDNAPTLTEQPVETPAPVETQTVEQPVQEEKPASSPEADALVSAGMSKDGAQKVSAAIATMSKDSPQHDKWATASLTADSVEDQLTAIRYYSDKNAEANYQRFSTATKYDVTPATFFEFYVEALNHQADHALSQADVKGELANRPDLSNEQKAAIWQLCGAGWAARNNPYDTTISGEIKSAYDSNKG